MSATNSQNKAKAQTSDVQSEIIIKTTLQQREQKKYPTKTHKQQKQKLKQINFSQLSVQQVSLLQDLSTFTPHREFIKMLTNRYSDMKKKQYFIKENGPLLTTGEFSQFNRAKFKYQNYSMTFAGFFTTGCALTGFMIGLWLLPARKTPWKYTAFGFGIGLLGSYAFWRVQIYHYHNKMNQQFRSIIRDKYQSEKRRVI